jgi:hypothetical protein
VHLLAVPVGAGEVLDIDPELHVADELVEAAVAQHPVEVLAQRSPALPLISSTCATRPVRSPYCPSHLAAVLGPDPGDAREVVAGLADERGEVAVALGAHAVLLGPPAGVIRHTSETPRTG